jgi:tRNA-splicing ligase RtcB (3'-phosphate/5'-hydroxy nucleic acid ligase)
MSLITFGKHDDNTITQATDVLNNGSCVAFSLMADGHYGYIMPVGGVAAYDNAVSVPGVGFDIACGNCAIKTDIKLSDIADVTFDNPFGIAKNPELTKIANQIQKSISFGIGRSNLADDAPVDDPLFYDPAWNIIPNVGKFREDLRDKARKQLGTVGSGNHYVDVFVDREDGHIWVGVHFGSRGLGHTIASNFLSIGQGGAWGDKAKEVEVILGLDTPSGQDYWALMELAGRYAYAGREWVTRKTVEILGGKEIDMVHNHHNFAWKETHWIEGVSKEVVVVRKGATPAFPNQRGFVGGSMGDDAVILKGSECLTPSDDDFDSIDVEHFMQSWALFSTVHGAGRVMSRTEAAGKRDRKSGQLKKDKVTGEILKAPKVTREMQREWLDREGVILRGGGVDESPHVYRRLTDVLAAQGDTIQVLHTLKPLIVVMAGDDIYDPFKD